MDVWILICNVEDCNCIYTWLCQILYNTMQNMLPQYVGRSKALETSASRRVIQNAVVSKVALSSTVLERLDLPCYLICRLRAWYEHPRHK